MSQVQPLASTTDNAETAPEQRRDNLPGHFIVVDGPRGVGKTTITRLLGQKLGEAGPRTITKCQPSRSPIGNLLRDEEHDFRGLALACLVAADRYHLLATEILPALTSGHTIVCDQYLPSALILQYLDEVPGEYIARLNGQSARPDLTIILLGDDKVCRRRAHQPGVYRRLAERLDGESDAYQAIAELLATIGYRTLVHDIGDDSPEEVAQTLVPLIKEKLSW
ncbi:dTMP kinase [Actinoplanes sp. NPDC020271]|uniref:dTMP kinase n=1 Tax=Actinoplanes sp. NPDC020271 TaxID=3363896 RepID=UPI0037A2C34B